MLLPLGVFALAATEAQSTEPPARERPASEQPRFLETPCIGDFGEFSARISCGSLVVAEDRGGDTSRRVALPVTIVRARTPRPHAVPVIFLHGGPGSRVVESLPERLRAPPQDSPLIAADQDWIFFDQRGTGLAAPSLDCGSVALTDSGPETGRAVDALAACAARLANSGIDFRSYYVRPAALDVQDLRRALDLPAVDLLGVSYGTRVALEVLRLAPDGIRAVVLDSPWTPEAAWVGLAPSVLSRELREVMRLCAAEQRCNSRYPDLESRFDRWLAKTLARPVSADGRTYTAENIAGHLLDELYGHDSAPLLPARIQGLMQGDFRALSTYVDGHGSYAEALHLSHMCREHIVFEQPTTAAEWAEDPIAEAMARSLNRYIEACEPYVDGPGDRSIAEPVSSDVPALFLAPGIDAGCPAELAERAVERFPRGRLVGIPNATHVPSRYSRCARAIVREFLRDPERTVDDSCVAIEHARFEFAFH